MTDLMHLESITEELVSLFKNLQNQLEQIDQVKVSEVYRNMDIEDAFYNEYIKNFDVESETNQLIIKFIIDVMQKILAEINKNTSNKEG